MVAPAGKHEDSRTFRKRIADVTEDRIGNPVCDMETFLRGQIALLKFVNGGR